MDVKASLTPAAIAAFEAMWPAGVAADDELRSIIAALTTPADKDGRAAFVAQLVAAIVGDAPDLASWLQAVAVGSFQLGPHQEYGRSARSKSRARLLQRQQGNIDLPAAAAGGPHAQQEGVRLIVASMLLKEMRKNVAAKAALGPAWPVMVAVMEQASAEEMRRLHQFGADPRLTRLLGVGVRLALRRYLATAHPAGVPAGPSAAEWRRSLPPGADPSTYLATEPALVTRLRGQRLTR